MVFKANSFIYNDLEYFGCSVKILISLAILQTTTIAFFKQNKMHDDKIQAVKAEKREKAWKREKPKGGLSLFRPSSSI